MAIIDTDLLIQYLRGNPLATKYLDTIIDQEGEMKTTIFTVGELFKGVYESSNPAKTEREVTDLLLNCAILYPTLDSTRIWAQITTELKTKYGKQLIKDIGDIDQLIASIVLSSQERIITRNVNHYDKIRGLEIINWEQSVK